MIGHGFMGAAHSQGWRVAPHFFDLDAQPVMELVVGRSNVEASASQWGWNSTATDWREAIERDDIDIVDIVTPGDSHAEIAIAALDAGKHVLCEKPLANTVAEAEAMTDAATRAAARGVFAMTGFTFRRVPAATFARDLVASGRLGRIYQVRASYLQDWLADPNAPFVWRLDKSRAGSGALGDIGAHAVDLSQFITGSRLTQVSGIIETLVPERSAPGGGTAPVTVDDLALFTGRFDTGVLANFEATRFATGRKNALRVEVSGSEGAISFDLENMNSLNYYDATAPEGERGFTSISVTEAVHPYIDAWWPPGHILGYEHGFSNQVKDFVDGITSGTQPTPSFADGLQVQRVLAAVEASSANGSAWLAV
ncbi:MAG: Gfo/Idh/MocA family oxidoreductase [Salinibacterium sp.]|nr:Gfo/Idh/MocA family oxidoreductase [Salinibacterium sp.]